MYDADATYSGRIIGAREAPPHVGPDAPGQGSWFHGDVAAHHRGEVAAVSWESMLREGHAVLGQRNWFSSDTEAQHRREKAVAPRDRFPREGLAAPGLTGWYHREDAAPRLREPHRLFPRHSPLTARQVEYHSPMVCDPPSVYR